MLKVAQSSFQYFPRSIFWCVIITTRYQLMLQSRYQKTAESLVSPLLSFSWHYLSPQQQYNLPKTPLISALSAYISKTARCNFFLIERLSMTLTADGKRQRKLLILSSLLLIRKAAFIMYATGGAEDFFFSGSFFYIPPKVHTNFQNPPSNQPKN